MSKYCALSSTAAEIIDAVIDDVEFAFLVGVAAAAEHDFRVRWRIQRSSSSSSAIGMRSFAGSKS